MSEWIKNLIKGELKARRLKNGGFERGLSEMVVKMGEMVGGWVGNVVLGRVVRQEGRGLAAWWLVGG